MNEFLKPIQQDAISTTGKVIITAFALNNIKRQFFIVEKDSALLEAQQRTNAEGNKKKYLSAFGLPVFDSLIFKAGSYVNQSDETVFYNQVELAVALMEISMSKNIIKTPITGRAKGTVKEFISTGDYKINIKGVLATKGQNLYPEQEFADLLTICELDQAVEVASNLFQRFGIENIVIEDYDFPQEEGMRNLQRFDIQAVSDFPFILKSVNNL